MIKLKNKELEKLIWTLDAVPLDEKEFRTEAFGIIKLLAERLEKVEDRLEETMSLYQNAVIVLAEIQKKVNLVPESN